MKTTTEESRQRWLQKSSCQSSAVLLLMESVPPHQRQLGSPVSGALFGVESGMRWWGVPRAVFPWRHSPLGSCPLAYLLFPLVTGGAGGARGACRTRRTVWQVWRWSRQSGTAAYAAGVGAGPNSFRRGVWRCLVPDDVTLGGELGLGAGPDS